MLAEKENAAMTASVVLFEGRNALFELNRTITLQAAERHTKLVRALRVILALGILGLGGSVAFFIAGSALNPHTQIETTMTGGQIRAVNPRITGRDKGGTPYVITAQSAERPETTADVTELVSPRLDFSSSGVDAPASIVEAARGVFDQAKRTLDLLNGVRFRTDNGYRFESEHARVFVDEGRVVGDRMIMGAGPLGSIQAQSFEIQNSGDRVVFTGNVVARLYPDRPATAATEGLPGATLSPDGLIAPPTSSATPQGAPAPSGANPALDKPAAPHSDPNEVKKTP
jgi:lipopolysaccharide export system protein LptC